MRILLIIFVIFVRELVPDACFHHKMIHFDENQGTSSVTFDQLKRGTYYVAETDAEGKVVAEGTYNNGSYVAQYQAGNKVMSYVQRYYSG